jgi:hypothetical protein
MYLKGYVKNVVPPMQKKNMATPVINTVGNLLLFGATNGSSIRYGTKTRANKNISYSVGATSTCANQMLSFSKAI